MSPGLWLLAWLIIMFNLIFFGVFAAILGMNDYAEALGITLIGFFFITVLALLLVVFYMTWKARHASP